MISILTPTRGRVPQLTRMVESARATAKGPIEFSFFVDDDDVQSVSACVYLGAKYTLGPRSMIHSARWDECLPNTSGEFLFSANDDIVFRTPGWDKMIEAEFAKFPDKILMVHGDDAGSQGANFGCHPCVHLRWIETLGYFFPSYFDGEYPDTWVNDLANRIGRRRFLPFVTEHMHRIYGKAVIDETTLNYLRRQQIQNPALIYKQKEAERIADEEKLRAVML